MLALPLQPLCRDDCPGLCPECGARLADDPGHAHEAVDPRWAALQAAAEPTRDQLTRHAPARTAPPDRHHPGRGETVAVPKRKMSRSNTRSRRAQWKTTAAPAGAVRALPRAQAAAHRVPDLRHLQRPRRPRRLSAGPGTRRERAGRGGRCRTGTATCPRLLDVTVDARPARAGADPPLLRLRERRPAHQRAAGVPRRLGARPGRHRHALPQPPRPARGAAGQAARRGGQHARAGRRRPRAAPRRATSGSAAARRPPAAGTSPRSWPTPSRRCSAPSTSTTG